MQTEKVLKNARSNGVYDGNFLNFSLYKRPYRRHESVPVTMLFGVV